MTEADTDPTPVEFGSKAGADDARERFARWIAESDDRRKATVLFKPGTPQETLDTAEGLAADDRRAEAEKVGQIDLEDGEKAQIRERSGFDVGDVTMWTHARRVKALAAEHGVTSWLDHYDPQITPGAHVPRLRTAGDETGRDSYELTDDRATRKASDSHRKATGRKAEERAREGAREGHQEAVAELRERFGYTDDDIAELIPSDGDGDDSATTEPETRDDTDPVPNGGRDDAHGTTRAVETTDDSGTIVRALRTMAAEMRILWKTGETPVNRS